MQLTKKRFLVLAGLVIASLWSTSAGAQENSDPPARLRPVRGPVRLALTAMAIAPGKDSGQPWDCCGRLPEATAQRLRQPLNKLLKLKLASLLVGGAPAGILAEVLPWAFNAIGEGVRAPDAQATLYVDGNPVKSFSKVANSFSPSWAAEFSDPLTVSEGSDIAIEAWDIDMETHDKIGNCTHRGVLMVDSNGYVAPDRFTCNSQLWAVALRVIEVGRSAEDAAETAESANRPRRRRSGESRESANYLGHLDRLQGALVRGFDSTSLVGRTISFMATIDHELPQNAIVFSGSPRTFCIINPGSSLKHELPGSLVTVQAKFDGYNGRSINFSECSLASESN